MATGVPPGVGIVALFIGLLMMRFGVVRFLKALEQLPIRRRIAKARVARIAGAPRQGRAALRGRVVAGAEGLLDVPYSDVRGVACKVSIYDPAPHRTLGYQNLVPIFKESMSRDFLLDDGSGERAEVEPARAELDGRRIFDGRMDSLPDGGEALRRFAVDAGPGLNDAWPGTGRLEVRVEAILDGDEISVVGPISREGARGEEDTYRAEGPRRTVLAAGVASDDALLITPAPLGELTRSAVVGVGLGPALLIAGLALVAVGAYLISV
ncbi:MAG: hypothetical protein OZ928_08030 [Polyangiaceae bacterium]|nr:hypothetical protein [Polyangiaceae bacterium]